MATSIKLKVLSLSDTRNQSSRELIRQILIKNLGGERSIWIPQNTKLTGSKTFRRHAAHYSVTASYQKHETRGRCAFVQQSGSHSVWRDRQLVVQSCSVHTACVFRECGCESWKCTGASSVTECGCHVRKTLLCVNVTVLSIQIQDWQMYSAAVWTWRILYIYIYIYIKCRF